MSTFIFFRGNVAAQPACGFHLSAVESRSCFFGSAQTVPREDGLNPNAWEALQNRVFQVYLYLVILST